MCAIPDRATTEEFRKRKGPQRAYKVLRRLTAQPSVITGAAAYCPGRNVDSKAVKTYLGYVRGCTRGFHCFLGRKGALRDRENDWHDRENLTVVCVSFDPADVIVVEGHKDWDPCRQIVVRALHISERAWKQAGLPTRKGGAS